MNLRKMKKEMSVSEFQLNVRDSKLWIERGQALRRAAEVVHKAARDTLFLPGYGIISGDHAQTSNMLFGMALEAGLKARILLSNPESVKVKETADGITFLGFRGISGDGHDLIKLGQLAGIIKTDTNPQFLEVFRDLTRCIRWLGRYPVPKNIATNRDNSNSTSYIKQGAWMKDWVKPFLDDLLGVEDEDGESTGKTGD